MQNFNFCFRRPFFAPTPYACGHTAKTGHRRIALTNADVANLFLPICCQRLTVLAPSRRVSSRFGRKRVDGLPRHIARCTRNHTPSVVARQPSKIRGAASSSQRSPGLLRCNKNHARGDDTSILRQSHRAHPAPCGSGTHARARSRYIAITLSF